MPDVRKALDALKDWALIQKNLEELMEDVGDMIAGWQENWMDKLHRPPPPDVSFVWDVPLLTMA